MRREERLLLYLCAPALPAPRVAAIRRLFEVVNVPRLVTAARSNGVSGLVLFQLRRYRLRELLPAGALRQLADDYEHIALRNEVLLHDLRGLLERLQASGIAAAPVGLTALLYQGVYPDRGMRLVEPCELAVAADEPCIESILAEAGFRPCGNGLHRNGRGTELALHAVADVTQFAALRASAHLIAARLRERSQQALGHLADLNFVNARLVQTGESPVRSPGPRIGQPKRPGIVRAAFCRARRWLRDAFPRREEMLRRHGGAAAGLGLYALYAQRLWERRQTDRERPHAGRNHA